ncbi:hypothetical protein KC19_8G189600 [Ceratodon purpureus]|uniref:Uncharacterized protein n=1 Tax=Ceratodon purpureus TaxID=3225 RepID=A0A8T0H3T2_CERPU|nr:hypothetical protein KC19_8G189600 [Ceratodon purpureus]
MLTESEGREHDVLLMGSSREEAVGVSMRDGPLQGHQAHGGVDTEEETVDFKMDRSLGFQSCNPQRRSATFEIETF